MADVYAIFGTLLALGIAFPGMLMAWWLLFPQTVERASKRFEVTPWRCFGLGIPAVIAILIPIIILFSIPFPFSQFMGALSIFTALGFAGIGTAGMAAKMGKHLQNRSNSNISESGAFLRGAVALELAAAFPLIGWVIVIPMTFITSFGAAVFAILRWMPKKAKVSSSFIDESAAPVKA